MTKTLTLLVHITEAVEAFAVRHGAYFEKSLQRWVVEGDVPPELESYAQKQKRTRDFIAEKAPQCKLCGCEMRLRNSAYGDFWGCSAFPRCKGSKSVNAIDVAYSADTAKRAYLCVDINKIEDAELQDELEAPLEDAEKPLSLAFEGEQSLEVSADEICKKIVDSHFRKAHVSDNQPIPLETSAELQARSDEVRRLAVEKLGFRQAKNWLEGPKVTLKGGRPADLLKTLEGCDKAKGMLNDLYS